MCNICCSPELVSVNGPVMESNDEAHIILKYFLTNSLEFFGHDFYLKYFPLSRLVKETVSSSHNPSITDLEEKDESQQF